MPGRPRSVAVLLALALLGLGAWGVSRLGPGAQPNGDDTGLDPEAQRELLREIGYLK